jgi:hypothetical protein
MKISTLEGQMNWRIMVNYRAELGILRQYLPAPFVPRSFDGYGMVGVSLLNQKNQRIKGLPKTVGLDSLQVLHRIAVSWTELDETYHGVYVPHRNTNSLVQVLAGGRMYPGLFHIARFRLEESEKGCKLEMKGRNQMYLKVQGQQTSKFPRESVMRNVETARNFFGGPSLGFSPRYKQMIFDGLELVVEQSKLQPLRIEHLRSSFFEDTSRFPKGSIYFDHALIEKQVAHQWHYQRELLAPRPWQLSLPRE